MSAASHGLTKLAETPGLLQELLHSLSQPLTSLRCSLELSFDEGAEKHRKSVRAALQQTEDVIGMIQLMREYLDVEQSGPEVHGTQLAQVIRSVIEELHRSRWCAGSGCG